MSEYTFNRRLQQLIQEIMQNPHKEEILKLAHEQLAEDSTVVRPVFSA